MPSTAEREIEFKTSVSLLVHSIIASLVIGFFVNAFTVHIWGGIYGWVAVTGLLSLGFVMHYISTSVIVDNKGVTYRTGILTASERHIQYSAINTLDIRQDPIARMADYGDIYIYTGNDKTKIRLKGIDQPRKLKRLIEERL